MAKVPETMNGIADTSPVREDWAKLVNQLS